MSDQEANDGVTTGAENPQKKLTKPESSPKLEPNKAGRFEGQHIGIDIDTLEAYCGSLRWKVRKDAHTKTIVDQVREIQHTYEKEFMRLGEDPSATTWDKEVEYEKATKAILDLALTDFKYDEAANHLDAGPGALGILANELRTFLVDLGGRAGQKHLQMLSKLAIQSTSPGTKI